MTFDLILWKRRYQIILPFKREYKSCPPKRDPLSSKTFALELPFKSSFSNKHSPSAAGETYMVASGNNFAQLAHPSQCWRLGAEI